MAPELHDFGSLAKFWQAHSFIFRFLSIFIRSYYFFFLSMNLIGHWRSLLSLKPYFFLDILFISNLINLHFICLLILWKWQFFIILFKYETLTYVLKYIFCSCMYHWDTCILCGFIKNTRENIISILKSSITILKLDLINSKT